MPMSVTRDGVRHDVECLNETLDNFEKAVDITLNKLPAERRHIVTA